MVNDAQHRPVHPRIVHFVVALLLLGVALRIASLIPKLKFANHAAAVAAFPQNVRLKAKLDSIK